MQHCRTNSSTEKDGTQKNKIWERQPFYLLTSAVMGDPFLFRQYFQEKITCNEKSSFGDINQRWIVIHWMAQPPTRCDCAMQNYNRRGCERCTRNGPLLNETNCGLSRLVRLCSRYCVPDTGLLGGSLDC